MPPTKGDAAMKDLSEELEQMKSPYKVLRFLSSGSYGAVCAGQDANEAPVAIKRVYTTVSDGKTVNILSDTFLAKRVLREVRLLNHFNHPNILGLKDLMLDLAKEGRFKLYLVTELMRTDLAQVVSDPRIAITPQHIQYFMYNILLGLHALHEAGVVHRDLHPGNILLAENNDVCICDFNLAREDTDDLEKTHYVTHRWYRAPELVMQYKGFTKVVDIWSAGCIMGELFNRKALFRGSTFYNQLNKIVEVTGTPKDEDVALFSSSSARDYLRTSLGQCPQRPWAQVVPTADELALDLISRMLCFNPTKRISAEQALKHPYFSDLYDPEDPRENLSEHFHFDESINDIPTMHKFFREEVERFRQTQARRMSPPPSGSPTLPKTASGEGHMPRTHSMMAMMEAE